MTETPDIAALARRLQALEDEQSIVRILSRCAHAVDYGDEDASMDSFTEDAVWEGRKMDTGETFIRHEGVVELREFFRGHTRAPHIYHKHLVADPRVELRGDTASCSSYVLFLVSGPGALPAMGGFGRYFDEFRRCADGQWRITSRLAEVEAWNPLWDELARSRRRKHLAAAP